MELKSINQAQIIIFQVTQYPIQMMKIFTLVEVVIREIIEVMITYLAPLKCRTMVSLF